MGVSECIWFWGLFFRYRYELAEDCADDDDAKDSIVELRKNVLYELRHHASFVQVRFHYIYILIFFPCLLAMCSLCNYYFYGQIKNVDWFQLGIAEMSNEVS